MIIKPNKIAIIFSLMLMCCEGKCIAQNDTFFEVCVHKVIVSDSDLIALLDTMYSLIGECEIDKELLFFYICESDFDGNNHYIGKALPYAASSYREMWNNEDLNEADELYWRMFYCFHKGILCICNADQEKIFKDISKSSDRLLLPLNMSQMDSFYLVVVPQIADNRFKYSIYTSCD